MYARSLRQTAPYPETESLPGTARNGAARRPRYGRLALLAGLSFTTIVVGGMAGIELAAWEFSRPSRAAARPAPVTVAFPAEGGSSAPAWSYATGAPEGDGAPTALARWSDESDRPLALYRRLAATASPQRPEVDNDWPYTPGEAEPGETAATLTRWSDEGDRPLALYRRLAAAAPMPRAELLNLDAAQPAPPPAEGDEEAYARIYEEPLPAEAETPVEPQAVLREAALPRPPQPPQPLEGAPWQRHAVPVTVKPGQPMIAIVLDDLGLNRPGTRRAIRLPGPLTLAFMTYAEGLPKMTAEARRRGHELLVHMPMEPGGAHVDPGPNVLLTSNSRDELARRIAWGLNRFEGYVGVNNHMGSRFTANPAGMAQVIAEVRARGLLFLDSLTSPRSVGGAMARRQGIPYALRDIFLDNNPTDERAIRRQLAKAERLARQRGMAIAIGHPHKATLNVLAHWLPEARRRGFALVPVSHIVATRGRAAIQTAGFSGEAQPPAVAAPKAAAPRKPAAQPVKRSAAPSGGRIVPVIFSPIF